MCLLPCTLVGIPKSLIPVLIHYLRVWMLFLPILPAGVVRGQFRKPPFEINALNAHQPFCIRVPERIGLSVVENKSSLIGPSGGNQGQRPVVDFAAVHSRQVHQRSVCSRNFFVPDAAVGDLMPVKPWDRIGMGFLSV
jgi:hypothetical protein